MILRPKGRIGYNQENQTAEPPNAQTTTMIRETLIPEQARLWASQLGQQAGTQVSLGNQDHQLSSLAFRQPHLLTNLLHRLQAQREARKNLQAQEFMMEG